VVKGYLVGEENNFEGKHNMFRQIMQAVRQKKPRKNLTFLHQFCKFMYMHAVHLFNTMAAAPMFNQTVNQWST
jgi:hypothetical protein